MVVGSLGPWHYHWYCHGTPLQPQKPAINAISWTVGQKGSSTPPLSDTAQSEPHEARRLEVGWGRRLAFDAGHVGGNDHTEGDLGRQKSTSANRSGT